MMIKIGYPYPSTVDGKKPIVIKFPFSIDLAQIDTDVLRIVKSDLHSDADEIYLKTSSIIFAYMSLAVEHGFYYHLPVDTILIQSPNEKQIDCKHIPRAHYEYIVQQLTECFGGLVVFKHISSSLQPDLLFFSICGNIGVGKTILAKKLGQEFNLPVYYENVADNPILDKFYSNMEAFSFLLQMHLLADRVQQHEEIIKTGKGGIQDRTLYEDLIFASILVQSEKMKKEEYETYTRHFNLLSRNLVKPHFIIFLDATPETCQSRIKRRRRTMEHGLETNEGLEYLKSWEKEAKKLLVQLSKVIPVIRIDWNNYEDKNIEKISMKIKLQYENSFGIHDLSC